jgi:hypothetical protein
MTRTRSGGPTGGRSVWPWLSLVPLVGVCSPIYAGVRARRVLWLGLGLLWAAAAVGGFVADSISSSGHNDFAGFLFILSWVGAAGTAFTLRPSYERQMGSDFDQATRAARDRLAERRRALELVASDPSLAQEIGIGRPDRRGAAHAGLIDVNNAPAAALQALPGVDANLAARIVEVRERLGGFSSLEDLGETLDIDGDTVERIRERAVFLPRS